VLPGEDAWHLCVRSKHADLLDHELTLFLSQAPRRSPRQIPSYQGTWKPGLLFALSLALFFLVQSYFGSSFTQLGSNTSQQIFGHLQLWRPLTSLTLHADTAHFLGNAAWLSFLGFLISLEFRAWLGWALILTSAVIANFFNAWLHLGEAFSSIGASTAVFSAWGLLVGLQAGRLWLLRRFEKRSWLTPIAAGLCLLAWTGLGPPPTDTGSHVFGFLCGLAFGIPWCRLPQFGAGLKLHSYWAILPSLILVFSGWIAAALFTV